MKKRTNNRTHHSPAERLMVRIGMLVIHSLLAVLGFFRMLIGGIFRMLWYTLRQIGSFFLLIGRSIRGAFTEHNSGAREALRAVRRAKKEGGLPLLREILHLLGVYIFGEHGILRTGFNYIMPVVSIVFLIAIVRYGAGLDYAIQVVCNGEELGIIESEADFEAAEADVRQRISSFGEEADISFYPTYTLKIVSENDQYVNSRLLADKLLANSNESLTEAYGVYVDGEFIGAVTEYERIETAMNRALTRYATSLNDMVSEVYYTKKVEYLEGMYLTDTIRDTQEVLELLTSEAQTKSRYMVQEGDIPQIVAMEFGMTMEELEELNPHIDRHFYAGRVITVKSTSRYIPIGYTKNMTIRSFIDYSSVEVETSALNLGAREVISHGKMGERTSEVVVTYIDGVESGRKILSTAVTKEPVPEQIGIGTYSPEPASKNTVFDGNGMFGWPVNGGYISDGYISDRNHKGIDIAAPYGTEIYASGSGTVVAAGWNSGGYGYYVIIEHADGYRTLYAHCSVVIAHEGQNVEKGQLIAKVGSTGNSTGNHCHYEVRLNNICVNPGIYLRVNAD